MGGAPLAALFGEARVAQMRDYFEAFAARFGVEGMRTSSRLPNTRRSLALAEVAREAGKLEAYREAAMVGYWREGLDLERPADLEQLAARAGLGTDALQRSCEPLYLERIDAIRQEAAELGVTGIPTFFFGDGPAVVGCQSYEMLAASAIAAGAAVSDGAES